MRKIAIFSSGIAPASERVISLFNEGNRIRVVALVTDSEGTASRIKEIDPAVEVFSMQEWNDTPDELKRKLTEAGVEKFALENCTPFADEDNISEEDIITLASEEEAPRQVVAAFSVAAPAIPHPAPNPNPTVEEEWAATLKMEYDPERAGEVPPPLPQEQIEPQAAMPRQEASYAAQGAPQLSSQGKMPDTYLIWAILATVLCCLVPGIVAIIFSSQVQTKYYMGDFEGAEKASRRAQIWIIVSFVLGILSATLMVPIALINP